MAYSYFNPNPRNKHVGDCVIRAIAKAFNISWESAYIEMTMQGYSIADLPSSNATLDSYLRSKGYRKKTMPDTCPDCYTFRDFAGEHFKDTYIVCTGTHVACIESGTIWDSWDSSDCTVIYYYQKDQSW